MQGQVSLLAIAALPVAAGVLISGFAPAWRRWFGEERALMLAGRVALGSTLLSGMLLALALYVLARRPDLAPVQDVLWASAGRTTVLALHLELGMLARVVCVVALTIALAVQVAALGDPRRGTGDLGRAALLLGGVLLTALATTVWGCALGWQIAALASGRLGQVAEDRSQRTGPFAQVAWRWSDGGMVSARPGKDAACSARRAPSSARGSRLGGGGGGAPRLDSAARRRTASGSKPKSAASRAGSGTPASAKAAAASAQSWQRACRLTQPGVGKAASRSRPGPFTRPSAIAQRTRCSLRARSTAVQHTPAEAARAARSWA